MEFKYYIKKLGSQELGYRNGRQTTGAYFYISKTAKSFFPPLSKTINNDSVNIQLEVTYRNNPIFVNLVYHNDRFNREGGTRDEYRIYLNREVAPDDFFFKPGDIILIERKAEHKYFLEKYREEEEKYKKLESIIATSDIKGNHALIKKINL